MGNLPLSSKVDFPWNFTKMMGNCFLRRFNLLERLQHFQNVSQRVPRPQFDLEVDWFVTKDLSNQHFPKNICPHGALRSVNLDRTPASHAD